jgi:hypothetical protein
MRVAHEANLLLGKVAVKLEQSVPS